jgi:hypothetical protein
VPQDLFTSAAFSLRNASVGGDIGIFIAPAGYKFCGKMNGKYLRSDRAAQKPNPFVL